MEHQELLSKLSILYVEDEPVLQDAFRFILASRVARLDFADNGLDGLNKYFEQQPDIVITDLEMPKMSGMEMVEKIKRADPNRPVIVVSAYNDDEHRVESADFFFTKPVMKRQIIDAIVSCVMKTRRYPN